jgi:hypothetical protein
MAKTKNTNILNDEIWKIYSFEVAHSNTGKIEVSNLGRIRTFNSVSDGKILNGSLTDGYRIVRFKFYSPRTIKTQKGFNTRQDAINEMARHYKLLEADFKVIKKNDATFLKKKNTLLNTLNNLKDAKTNLSLDFIADLKSRTIHKHGLVHRLVAEKFLKKPIKNQSIVIHLDHNKMNNKVDNLKWVTREEQLAHNALNKKKVAKKMYVRNLKNKTIKLTVQKVAQIKKQLNTNVTMRILAIKYKVSDMTIYRIKCGINWADIAAAE